MIRLETYRSCEPNPAPERAFVTVGDIVERRLKPQPHDFTAGHMVFYGETEEGARSKAETWIATERNRIKEREDAAQQRIERARLARAEKAATPAAASVSTEVA